MSIARLTIFAWLLVFALSGCARLDLKDRLRPSNDRVWRQEQSVLAYADIDGTHYTLRNIRDYQYFSVDDYVVNYVDRSLDLSQIQSVDFVMVPFVKTDALAHTMLSFGLDDGTWLSMSVEIRKELGERYSPIAGFGPKYELMYVLGEERDLIRLRTEHYQNKVYVYPTVAKPEQAQALFVDMMQRMNGLVDRPEFYNTLTNNCTTNLKDHVNRVSPIQIRENAWQVLLPGFSARYAYQIGLLDNRIPFEDLESIAYVNDLTDQDFDAATFSQNIRKKRYLIDRAAVRQQARTKESRTE